MNFQSFITSKTNTKDMKITPKINDDEKVTNIHKTLTNKKLINK